MSNVTVQEVMDIAAVTFGVTKTEMAAHWRGRRGADLPLGMIARGVAVMLARRHTRTTLKAIAAEFGWNQTASPDRFRRLALKVEELAFSDWVIRVGIEAAEAAIEELHEWREAEAARIMQAQPERSGRARRARASAQAPL